jgi:hypothetical protein
VSQSSVIAAALIGGFLLWLALNGKLAAYWSILTGGGAPGAAGGGATAAGAASSVAGQATQAAGQVASVLGSSASDVSTIASFFA